MTPFQLRDAYLTHAHLLGSIAAWPGSIAEGGFRNACESRIPREEAVTGPGQRGV